MDIKNNYFFDFVPHFLGKKVLEQSFQFLDTYFPLEKGLYAEVESIDLDEEPQTLGKYILLFTLANGVVTRLRTPSKFVGFQKSRGNQLTNVLLLNNHLHVEIVLDKNSVVGKGNKAGIHDIILESAGTYSYFIFFRLFSN